MTSKKALKELINYLDLSLDSQDEERVGKLLNTIKKDLEVLEILKKHYDRNSLSVSLDNFISFSIYKNDNDFKKIKEWLENEKTTI